MRKSVVVAAFAAALGVSGVAHAAGDEGEFGKGGTFILSANRLVPLFAYTTDKTTLDQNNVKTTDTTSNSSISILWGRSTNEAVPHTIPRVGFDYAVVDHVTVGGDLVAIFGFSGTNERKVEGNNQTQTNSTDAPTITGFGIAPRGGYVLGLSPILYLWLRGGLSFYTLSQKSTQTNNNGQTTTTNTISRTLFSIDLEPQLVISPWNHFGFTVGVLGDIPLTGSQKVEQNQGAQTTTTDYSYSSLHIGLSAGLLGYF